MDVVLNGSPIYELTADSVLLTSGHREEPVPIFPAQWQRRPTGSVFLEAGDEIELVRLDPIPHAAKGAPDATGLFICRGRPDVRTELFSALLSSAGSPLGVDAGFGVISPWLRAGTGAPEWNAARFDEIAAAWSLHTPGSRLEAVVSRPAS